MEFVIAEITRLHLTGAAYEDDASYEESAHRDLSSSGCTRDPGMVKALAAGSLLSLRERS